MCSVYSKVQHPVKPLSTGGGTFLDGSCLPVTYFIDFLIQICSSTGNHKSKERSVHNRITFSIIVLSSFSLAYFSLVSLTIPSLPGFAYITYANSHVRLAASLSCTKTTSQVLPFLLSFLFYQCSWEETTLTYSSKIIYNLLGEFQSSLRIFIK